MFARLRQADPKFWSQGPPDFVRILLSKFSRAIQAKQLL